MNTQTREGAVRGMIDESGVAVFRGIPYGAPPVGPLRFRPPRSREPWNGVRDCTASGPVCPQGAPGAAKVGAQDEDCLNLNVWTPNAGESLPVVVYFPGGGYVSGNASARLTDGAGLARRGVVVVAANYRLHALGFLDLDESHGPNAGMLDHIAALRWVRENAAAFGGDPDNVTICGYSAGGNSVGTLLAAPDAKGLFHRAVIQDGAAVLNLRKTTTRQIATDFLELMGIDRADRGALEGVSVDDVLGAVGALARTYGGVMPTSAQRKMDGERRKGLTWTPTNGPTLPLAPLDAVRSGSAAEIDLLVGTTADSMTLLSDHMRDVGPDDIAAYLGDQLGAGRSLEQVLGVYGRELPDAPMHDVLGAVMTDLLLAVPAIKLAEAQLEHHDRVWLYEFCRPNPATGKAAHGIDTGLWFGNVPPGTPTDDPIAGLAAQTADVLASFAASGDPRADGLDAWCAYDLRDRATMLVDVRCRVERDPHAGRRELWAEATLP